MKKTRRPLASRPKKSETRDNTEIGGEEREKDGMSVLDRIRLIVDLKGFAFPDDERFHARELGWMDGAGCCSGVSYYRVAAPFEFEKLSRENRVTASHVCQFVHGLPFDPQSEEQARFPARLEDDLRRLFEVAHRATDAHQRQPSGDGVVAFKGGFAERRALQSAVLPAVDLEEMVAGDYGRGGESILRAPPVAEVVGAVR